jgi:hypothetical protein
LPVFTQSVVAGFLQREVTNLASSNGLARYSLTNQLLVALLGWPGILAMAMVPNTLLRTVPALNSFAIDGSSDTTEATWNGTFANGVGTV